MLVDTYGLSHSQVPPTFCACSSKSHIVVKMTFCRLNLKLKVRLKRNKSMQTLCLSRVMKSIEKTGGKDQCQSLSSLPMGHFLSHTVRGLAVLFVFNPSNVQWKYGEIDNHNSLHIRCHFHRHRIN